MASSVPEDRFKDDEVFFGKLSLKEIKKHILWNRNHEYNSCSNDVKIIETHSTPNLIQQNSCISSPETTTESLSPNASEFYPGWEVKPTDDSFLKVEKMVADLCVTPQKEKEHHKLDNTLDIIDYILSNGPENQTKSSPVNCSKGSELTVDKTQISLPETKQEFASNCNNTDIKLPLQNFLVKSEESPMSKNEYNIDSQISAPVYSDHKYVTPIKNEIKHQSRNCFITPILSTASKQNTPIFKTPKPLFSHKKAGTPLKKTPSKNNAYQHIASPVASYIKNCPTAPLMKEVRPTKPLAGPSSIPKFVKNSIQSKVSNKENINLPAIAYRSAKKTKVIDVPDDEKLPATQWMKKITSSLPKPLVMQHGHRELNLAKRILGSQQEDSFADLSLQQAEISVCTQKSAFNRPKKHL